MQDDPAQGTLSDDNARRILDALDFEIAQIRNEQQSLGWTTWVTFAGIGGALWWMIDQLKSVSSLSNVMHVYLVCALTYVVVSSVYYALHQRRALNYERRVRPLQLQLEPNADPPVLLLAVVELVALWSIAVCGWPEASLHARVLAAIFSGGLAIVALVGFASALFNFQVPSRSNSKRTAVATVLVFLVVLAWPLVEYTRLLLTDRGITASDYRTGGLIEVLVILLVMLGQSLRRPLQLDPLIALRRDVALKRIDLIQAQRQIEILVLGIVVEEALQRDVERLYEILRDQSEEHGRSQTRVNDGRQAKALPRRVTTSQRGGRHMMLASIGCSADW